MNLEKRFEPYGHIYGVPVFKFSLPVFLFHLLLWETPSYSMIKDPLEDPLSQNEHPGFPPPMEKIPETKEELLKMIENREVVVSKALYFENGEPACFMDVRGREELVPEPIPLASYETPSSVALEQVLDPCGEREENKLVAMNIQNFVLEGTQVAHPLIMLGGGCLLGLVGEGIKLDNYPDTPPGYDISLSITVSGIAAAGTQTEPKAAIATLRGLGAAFARMLGLVTVGYVACGKTVGFFLEGVRETIDQDIRLREQRKKEREQERELSMLQRSYFTTNRDEGKKIIIIANNKEEQMRKSDNLCQLFVSQNSLKRVASYKESTCQPSPTGYRGSGTSECLCVYNDLIKAGLLYRKL